MEKEHLNYKKFIDKIDKIVLSDEKKVKSNYEEAERKVYAIIDNIEKLSDETKKGIVNSIFENNGKTDGLAEQLTETYDVSSETANKIYESIDKKLKKDDFKHMGKVPYGKWERKPGNYTGFNDKQYGTAFQCHYVEELGLFFVVIDIDAHHSDTDIPITVIESSIPEEYRDTRVINTPSGGKHYYYLSKQPPSEETEEINIDYQTIDESKVEIGEKGFKNKNKGRYVVASYRWSYDGLKKEEYIHDTSSNEDILIVENTDVIIKAIKAKLESKGYMKKETPIVKKDSQEFVKKPLTHPIKEKINENIISEETGIQLITQVVKEIIKKTEGHHNSVLLALEGGLENIGLTKTDRKKILFDALELANDDTNEHKTQINSSLSKEGEKRGFRFLRRNYENIISEINQIFLLKQKYWPSISKKNYQLIGLHYNELISKLFNKFDKGSYRRRILKYIDAYLNVKGLGLHERFRLIEDINKEYGITDLKNLFEVIKENRIHSLIKNGHMNLDETLYDKLKDNTTKNERRTLDNLVHELDMQLSITQFKSKTPNIQPLTNLVNRPNGLEAYKRRQEASKFLRQNENLKKTENGSYIFDSVNTNSYIPIDANKLGNYLTRKYPILELGIEATELENILGLSGEFDELHNEFYLFNNGVLNLHKREFTPTRDFKDYFSIKKMDCKLNLNKMDVNINNPPSCLVDRVLREILIPNYDEEKKKCLDYGYYYDFLQRLGSAFNTRIKEKKFACYYGKGDNGKDILIEILKMAFGDRCLLATMDILQDEKADLSEYDVVIIDELDKHSFKDAIAFIKRITGGEEEGTAKRKLYQHDIFKPKNPSAFFLFTNEIPAVPLTDTAFYRREDALELQNRFTENPDTKKKNEFRADSSLKDKIKNSKEDSLEWLINAGINAYYGCYGEDGYFKGFTKAQTADATKMIVSNTDPLSKFLRETYVEDETKKSKISNREILISYKNYCQIHNLTVGGNISSIIMGNAIKSVFGDIKKPNSKDTLYFLKVKKEDDNAITYYIDSTYDWWNKRDEIPEDTYDSHEQIYNQIKLLETQCLAATKGQLKKQFGHLDVEEILNNLVNIGLIFEGRK